MQEEISGAIERITYFNEENGYSVIKILPVKRYPRAQARDGTVAVVGIMPPLSEGESARFRGEWEEHKRFGWQFRAEQASPVLPQTETGIINYLCGDKFPGIGAATARKVVDHFGDKTVQILDVEPSRIHDVPNLSTAKANRLLKSWEKNTRERNTIIFLRGLVGISPKLAQRIWNEYGENSPQIIEDNPYQLVQDIHLVGFKTADDIARHRNMLLEDPHRLRAGLHHMLNELVANEGHTYVPVNTLLGKSADLLKVDSLSLLHEALIAELRDEKLVKDLLANGGQDEPIQAVYLPRFFRAETGATARLRLLSTTSSVLIRDHQDTNWEKHLARLSDSNTVSLSAQQCDAVQAALTSKLSVLTGGPGTGKTTTLQMLISALKDGDYRFNLASPTGRAAKRLSEATGREATTIHRMLGFMPRSGRFTFNEKNPLPADMVIVDEASMLDLWLFHSLLKALQPTTHLLLVGDVDQLPSVGAGNVLRDVIDSGIAHVTRLEQIFRQDDKSHIVSNAHRINQGRHPVTDNQSNDFFFFNISDPEAVAEMMVDIVKRRAPKRWDLDPVRDIQVIAPMYRGAAGVNNLNSRLQAELNGDFRIAEVKLGSRIFRVGDKVMQTRNNYDKEVFNGDIGFIDSIDDDDNSLEVVIDNRFVVYDFSEMDEMMHAYCISTHRSQGSEYPAVIMPILTQHFMMLQRNLLYTAITRAKRLVVLVGTRQAVHIAVGNNKVAERHSGLLQRLCG